MPSPRSPLFMSLRAASPRQSRNAARHRDSTERKPELASKARVTMPLLAQKFSCFPCQTAVGCDRRASPAPESSLLARAIGAWHSSPPWPGAVVPRSGAERKALFEARTKPTGCRTEGLLRGDDSHDQAYTRTCGKKRGA